MSRFLPILLLIIAIGCKKDEPIPIKGVLFDGLFTGPKVTDYFPSAPGSYWVYQRYNVDTNGNTTAIGSTDTVTVLKDTVVAGEIFTIYDHSKYSSNDLYRDSGDYIIDTNGTIHFSSTNYQDVLDQWVLGPLEMKYKMSDSALVVSVPAGTFETFNFKGTFTREPAWQCGKTVCYFDNQYALGVGKIRWSGYYTSPGPCISHLEDWLIAYYIAPE